LDSENTEEVLKILDDIAKEGKLVIAVTHSQIVADYGTRVVHLQDGKIDSDKSLRDAYPIPDQSSSQKNITHLSFGDTFRLAWEHMRYTKGRNILIILGAAIGIFSVIFMLGLGSGITGYINGEMTKQVNPNAIQVAKTVSRDNTDPNSINMTTADIDKLKSIKNVKKVEKAYFTQSSKVNYNQKNASLQFFQTWNATEKSDDITQGKKPNNNQIILLKSDAQKARQKELQKYGR
jgi:ABC-type antimicrobial peptide transport system, ATPase component